MIWTQVAETIYSSDNYYKRFKLTNTHTRTRQHAKL